MFIQNPAVGFFWYISNKNYIIKELLISKAGVLVFQKKLHGFWYIRMGDCFRDAGP